MKIRHAMAAIFVILGLALAASSAKAGTNKNTPAASAPAGTSSAAQDDSLRFEGEKRYHANCGRCHAAPPKFARRMMGTIIRHMRVRAALTDEDMRLILDYMSE